MQTRSLVGVGGTASNSLLVQTVKAVQFRSEVLVGGDASYCDDVHVVMGEQIRSEVGVGGWDSNWLELQTVKDVHLRSVVLVRGRASYCCEVHMLAF